MKPNEDIKFIDAEAYLPQNQGLTFKDIVLQHFKKIGNLASVEWRGGYYNEKTQVVSNAILTTKEYVPDTREEYSNAVDYLADILLPHFDIEMKDKEEDHNKELEKALEANDKLYREKKVLLKRKLFRELSSFLQRAKYFETEYADE